MRCHWGGSYHARMARRAQHLRCYVREANERTTSWIRAAAAAPLTQRAGLPLCDNVWQARPLIVKQRIHFRLSDINIYHKYTGCPKSHCAKVWAYCSACDQLICKITSGMFQKSSSFEEFNGFSEIDVHFLNERSFFTFFAPLTCLDHIPFGLLLFGP